MKIRSLGRLTDFIFAQFSGSIQNKGSYTVIQTPNNPGYFWGNYIIFDRPPQQGDLGKWKTLFDKEFPCYSEPQHYVFTWDTEKIAKGYIQEFLDDGFKFESAVVLTANNLQKPPHPNQNISIRKISSDEEWEAVIKLQTLCANPELMADFYDDFKRSQINQYRKMSEARKGDWFGAFIDSKLVGDLGIFFEGDIARYQNVGTHPDYRGQGICGTIVHAAGKIALDEYGVKTLVMEADPEYHAARIYESVGFARAETNYSLTWWKK